jgi:hypothetical protein
MAELLDGQRGKQAVLVLHLIDSSNNKQILSSLGSQQMQGYEQIGHLLRGTTDLACAQQQLAIVKAIRNQELKPHQVGIFK